MADICYYVEERLYDRFRGLAATVREGGAIFTIAFDDDIHLEISLDELNFIARAAQNLPEWLRHAEVDGPKRPKNGAPVVKSTVAKKDVQDKPAEQGPEEVKPARHGKRWTEDEERKMLTNFRDKEMSVIALAKLLDRSPSSVVSKLLHLDAIDVIPKR